MKIKVTYSCGHIVNHSVADKQTKRKFIAWAKFAICPNCLISVRKTTEKENS